MATREVHVNSVTIGGDRPLVLVAGPCVIEGEEVTLRIAGREISELILKAQGKWSELVEGYLR